MTAPEQNGEGNPNEMASEHLTSGDDKSSLARESRKFHNGRFVIKADIGEGAAGSVTMAFDTVLGRTCAIKCLHTKNRGKTQLLRFQREARASSRLKHPGVVEIFDFGIAADGTPYLVMEYVDGTSLLSFMQDKGNLPIPQAVLIASLIAEAMTHAHSNNVIHRDIKPSNIILTGLPGDTENVAVKVVDFGIAAVIEEESVAKTMTPTQGLTGSPFYMSPEQARRTGIDGRTDIYSLGCILFEMLVGEKPYCGETTLATVNMHMETPIPLAHNVAPNLNIPEPLSRLVEKMMAKSKDDRVLTMAEVVVLLKPFEIPTARGETKSELAGSLPVKVPKRHLSKKKILAAILALPVVFLLGFNFAPYLVHEMQTPMFPLPELKPVVERESQSESDFKNLSRLVGITDDKGTSISSKVFHLNGEAITDNTLKGVLLSGCDPPRDVFISRASITDRSLKLIAKCPTIETLHIDYCRNIEDGALVELLPMKNLVVLSLRGANLTDKALEIIAKMASLRLLVISDNPQLTISAVLKLTALPNLYSLGLGNTAVKGADFLALNQFKHLIALTLEHSEVSDKDLESIGKLNFLQRVALTDSTVPDSAILELAKIPSLHCLRIADCNGISIKTRFILKNKLRQRCLIEEKQPYREERLRMR